MPNPADKQPSELAKDLIKLLQENQKPLIRRLSANKLQVNVANKSFQFEVRGRVEQQRKDIS